MKKSLKNMLLILLMLSCLQISNGQVSSSFFQQNGNTEIKFLIDKIEAQAQSTIFNIFVLKNNSDNLLSGKVSLSVPMSWSIIGDQTIEVNVPSKDSIYIPFRISVSKNAIGDIGYSIVGTLTDLDGRTIKSAYSFVTIPRNTSFTSFANKRLTYIGKYQDKIEFEYLLDNKGNVNELAHIEAYTSDNISVEGSDEYNPFIAEYSLPPNSDTLIKLNITKTKKAENQSFASLKILSSSSDTSYIRTFWIRILDNIYDYKIPENEKCAIIELFARNLLTEADPFYSLLVKGRILFKKNQDLYYEYRNFNIQSTLNKDDRLGIFHKGYLGYKTNFSDLRIGSIEKTIEQDLYGNGANLLLKYKAYELEGVYVADIYDRYYSTGGRFQIPLWNVFLHGGSIYTDIYYNLNKTNLYFGGASFNFLKKNTIGFTVGYTGVEVGATNTNYIGYGMEFKYRLKFKRFKFDVKANYADPYYAGSYKGRFTVDGNLNIRFQNTSTLYAKYQRYNHLGQFDVYSSLSYTYKRDYDYFHIDYSKNINPFLSYQFGTDIRIESTDQFLQAQPFFNTFDSKLFISTNIRTKYSKIIFAPRISFGPVQMSVTEDTTSVSPLLLNTFSLSLSVYKNNIGLFSAFRYGPTNINENYLYFTDSYFAKWFFIMPYYSETVLDNRLKIDIRANYVNNIASQENNFSLTSQFSLFLPYDITFYFYNTISTRSKIDRASNIKYNYSTIYFDFGIRKEFNCNQPRVKYYNLDVTFYKDLNGNRQKEKNEPGINNIFVNIVRDFEKDMEIEGYDFSEAELMTDQFGFIEYRNIPNGNYLIKYQLLGDITGNYSLEQLETPILMDKDQSIDIPIMENNKIIGKVVLNRDPLSSLGPIDISNIRIIAEDTQGKTFSALTDINGNFVLYTPKADHYVLRINNIFYESFDIQQTEYIVKFNGYKQFEVTFVFDEKKRKINFDNNVVTDNGEIKMEELQVIRKTTLAGKIRDAITLEPLESEIQIIDNKTNKVISTAISNRLNGNYSISYVAGDHFRIEVKSKGYQDYIENLYIEQIISIQNITKEILMNKPSADGKTKQTFIIYDEKEQEQFKDNYKRGQKIPINNLNFDEKETRLSPNAYPDLDRLIDLLKKNSNMRVEVAGHADDTGKDRTDNLLSQRRAKAVSRYLVDHGISEDRIEVKSYSNSRPIVPGTNEKARQKNRRVEIIVL